MNARELLALGLFVPSAVAVAGFTYRAFQATTTGYPTTFQGQGSGPTASQKEPAPPAAPPKSLTQPLMQAVQAGNAQNAHHYYSRIQQWARDSRWTSQNMNTWLGAQQWSDKMRVLIPNMTNDNGWTL